MFPSWWTTGRNGAVRARRSPRCSTRSPGSTRASSRSPRSTWTRTRKSLGSTASAAYRRSCFSRTAAWRPRWWGPCRSPSSRHFLTATSKATILPAKGRQQIQQPAPRRLQRAVSRRKSSPFRFPVFPFERSEVVHPAWAFYALIRTQDTARKPAARNGDGERSRRRQPHAQAGADLCAAEEPRQEGRIDLRRRHAGSAARRLRLPALARHLLPRLDRRHLRQPVADPALQPPYRGLDRRRDQDA